MKILKIIKYYSHKLADIICFKPSYSYDQHKLFKKTKRYDIVLAKMPLNYIKLLDIPVDHRIRPFVIYKKRFNKLYVYYVSSKDISYLKPIKLSKNHYHLDKDSYLYPDKKYVLKKQHLIKYIDHLKKADINRL